MDQIRKATQSIKRRASRSRSRSKSPAEGLGRVYEEVRGQDGLGFNTIQNLDTNEEIIFEQEIESIRVIPGEQIQNLTDVPVRRVDFMNQLDQMQHGLERAQEVASSEMDDKQARLELSKTVEELQKKLEKFKPLAMSRASSRASSVNNCNHVVTAQIEAPPRMPPLMDHSIGSGVPTPLVKPVAVHPAPAVLPLQAQGAAALVENPQHHHNQQQPLNPYLQLEAPSAPPPAVPAMGPNHQVVIPDGPGPFQHGTNTPPVNVFDARKRYKETISKFPMFSGNQERFVEYELTVKYWHQQCWNWNQQLLVLLLGEKLEGEAKIMYLANSNRHYMDVSAYLSFLKGFFGSKTPCYVARKNLWMAKMTTSEISSGRYRGFLTRLTMMAKEAWPHQDAEYAAAQALQAWLINIEPAALQREVWRESRRTQDPERLVSVAVDEFTQASVQNQMGANGNNAVTVAPVLGGNPGNKNKKKSAEKPKKHDTRGAAQTPGDADKPKTWQKPPGKRIKRCYNCGEKGHTRNNCSYTMRVCFECKDAGHIIRECPKKNKSCSKN